MKRAIECAAGEAARLAAIDARAGRRARPVPEQSTRARFSSFHRRMRRRNARRVRRARRRASGAGRRASWRHSFIR
ncbi:hypothetical protein [Burkholderia pseudomallei]|uniref:hypothetical protein n=1 Tax=Burkholderia pseudomallei TaxID=28450 RepID=UPI0009763713|nr:hypothetical protein [Burkholderia pseudomallei]QBI39561.1 hypothetical protein EXY28_06560 [Burkholderia pseudomallei]QBI46247.1 hypothetical protein EXY72_06595 [Burkholderia pseudomallei]QBP48032.1 hypothetical protein E2R28_06620 [Burkholderia pseudomallei]QBP67941.1 hypothetical protein E2R25_06645 [Burkholderia pseudomallei]QBR23416.1 hypothetical protein E3O37_06620 [Burkholderia pseudomallei]